MTCPKCGGNVNQYRHPNSKVWCEACGFVLKEEGEKESQVYLDREEFKLKLTNIKEGLKLLKAFHGEDGFQTEWFVNKLLKECEV